jgi:hypothetical protein
MKFFLALLGFFFLLMTLGFAYIVWKVRKRVHQFRDAMRSQMDDDEYQRMADKNYYRKRRNTGPMFDEEYFKGDPNGWRNRTQANQQQQQQKQRRATNTASGVTIIDDRDPSVANKKIFAKDEGDYVDYQEN